MWGRSLLINLTHLVIKPCILEEKTLPVRLSRSHRLRSLVASSMLTKAAHPLLNLPRLFLPFSSPFEFIFWILSFFFLSFVFLYFLAPVQAARCTTPPPAGQFVSRASAHPSPPLSPSSSSAGHSRCQTGGCASESETPFVEVSSIQNLLLAVLHQKLCRRLRVCEMYYWWRVLGALGVRRGSGLGGDCFQARRDGQRGLRGWWTGSASFACS